VNLLPVFGTGVDLARHVNWPGERFKCRAARRPTLASCPSEGIPKSGLSGLAVLTTPGQLKYSVALALQQHGQQSALRKGRG
jgi:hypothetical protein